MQMLEQSFCWDVGRWAFSGGVLAQRDGIHTSMAVKPA